MCRFTGYWLRKHIAIHEKKKYMRDNDGKADLHNYETAAGWDARSIDFWWNFSQAAGRKKKQLTLLTEQNPSELYRERLFSLLPRNLDFYRLQNKECGSLFVHHIGRKITYPRWVFTVMVLIYVRRHTMNNNFWRFERQNLALVGAAQVYDYQQTPALVKCVKRKYS